MIANEREQARAPVRVLTSRYYERLAELEREHWWWRGMRRVADSLLDRVKLPAAGIRVLDAGCGTGLTLSRLETAMRSTPVGLDFSADALGWCRGRRHRRLIQADASKLPFSSGSFDLVVSLDVLQHLPRPHGDRDALAEFARVLSPGGVLLLRTNSRCGYRDVDAVDYQRYRLGELRSLLRNAGFADVVSSYSNFLPSLATTMIGRLRGRGRGSADPGLPGPPHRAFAAARLGYGWLALEAAYLRIGRVSLPYGHSIVALARKSSGDETG